MIYKLQSALKKGKMTIIVSVILWLLIAIVFVMPWTCGCYQMKLSGKFDMDAFLQVFTKAASNPIL